MTTSPTPNTKHPTPRPVLHPHAEMMATANRLIELLGPSCERIEVAGSLRRGNAFVKDIELVLIPHTEPILDIFDNPIGQQNRQYQLACHLLNNGKLQRRLDKAGHPHFGPKSQRLIFEDKPIDIFSVLPPAQYGVILLLRTGSGDFSKQFVTPWAMQGTFLQPGQKIHEGSLYQNGKVVPTPEEQDVFDAVGKRFIKPEDRL